MCPLYPIHLFFTYGVLLLIMWMAVLPCFVGGSSESTVPLEVTLSMNGSGVEVIELTEMETVNLEFTIDDWPKEGVGVITVEESSSDDLQHFTASSVKKNMAENGTKDVEGHFNLTGKLRGFSKVKLILSDGKDEEMMQTQVVEVKVRGGERFLETIFVIVVVTLVAFAYINMGCALDLNVIVQTLKKPVAPAIGISSQYLFMPIMSYLLGWLLFSDNPAMWIGLLITGCSPGGGASNMWTYVLGGSLDLSITMTFISTILAIVALPAWSYVLGRTILTDGTYSNIPYRRIVMIVVGLIVPCSIGLLIKRFAPKVANYLVKIIRPIFLIFLIFIMSFGIYAYSYIFSFFTWRVIISGICQPLFGYLFGFILAVLCNRPWSEVIAISVETGVQNNGLAIGVIKVAMSALSPVDDIAIIMPIACSMMTPLPLLTVLIVQRVRRWLCGGIDNLPQKSLYSNGFAKSYDTVTEDIHTSNIDPSVNKMIP